VNVEKAASRPPSAVAAGDIYALGAVLYELLTGRPPFRGATMLETFDQVRFQPPVPPRDLRPETPAALEVIILTCLAKLPEDRYPSAAALADDLRRFLKGAPVQGQAPRRRRRAPPSLGGGPAGEAPYAVLESSVVNRPADFEPAARGTPAARPRARKRRPKGVGKWRLLGAAALGGALAAVLLALFVNWFGACFAGVVVCLAVVLALSLRWGR
jgi:hypothetical protein